MPKCGRISLSAD
uniref:Uncharacterized protein n=1 Tax=Anguilla anguilla TaxID=7936 RepID=A0A0E9P5I8_ANGAN